MNAVAEASVDHEPRLRRALLSVALGLMASLGGCIWVRDQPLPREAMATDTQLQDFAGTYRLAADAMTDLGFLGYAQRSAGDKLELQVANGGLVARYRFADQRVEVGGIDAGSCRAGFDEGRLRYRKHRFEGTTILPGLTGSDEGTDLYLDENGDLVVIEFSWEGGLVLLIFPFYESCRTVHQFHRIDG